MEIPQEIFKQKNTERKAQYVADVSRWANSFCRAIMKNITFTQEYSSFVTQTVQDIYDKAFAQKRLEWQPTLTDVYNRISVLENEVKNDNDKAKEYLDAAMKEMGVSNPADIKITLLTTDTDGAKKQAEVLQEQYQKNLGITVEINQVTYKQRLQMETEKDYDMVVTGWVPDYSDAYSYLELWISDGQYNHSGYANAEYDKLLKDSQTETDAKTRQDMLFQAEQIFLGEDSALVPLQLRRDQYLINPKISNFNVYFVGYDFDLVYADISE